MEFFAFTFKDCLFGTKCQVNILKWLWFKWFLKQYTIVVCTNQVNVHSEWFCHSFISGFSECYTLS